jgi:hypothetical protein
MATLMAKLDQLTVSVSTYIHAQTEILTSLQKEASSAMQATTPSTSSPSSTTNTSGSNQQSSVLQQTAQIRRARKPYSAKRTTLFVIPETRPREEGEGRSSPLDPYSHPSSPEASDVPVPQRRPRGDDLYRKELGKLKEKSKCQVSMINCVCLLATLTFYQELVRNVAKNAFNIAKDKDIVGSQSAPADEVRAFCDGGSGPDKQNLKLNMWDVFNSPWNEAVHEELFRRLIGVKHSNSAYSRLPDLDDELWLYMIREKCKTLQKIWRTGQTRRRSNGREETKEEATARFATMSVESEKASRQRSRRFSVSGTAV